MSGILMGNLLSVGAVSITISPALIVLNTTAEQTFTCPGVKVGDYVFVNKPTAQAGLGIVGCRVTAADTIGITFSNNTGSSITPTASQTYLVAYFRPESVQTGVVA